MSANSWIHNDDPAYIEAKAARFVGSDAQQQPAPTVPYTADNLPEGGAE